MIELQVIDSNVTKTLPKHQKWILSGKFTHLCRGDDYWRINCVLWRLLNVTLQCPLRSGISVRKQRVYTKVQWGVLKETQVVAQAHCYSVLLNLLLEFALTECHNLCAMRCVDEPIWLISGTLAISRLSECVLCLRWSMRTCLQPYVHHLLFFFFFFFNNATTGQPRIIAASMSFTKLHDPLCKAYIYLQPLLSISSFEMWKKMRDSSPQIIDVQMVRLFYTSSHCVFVWAGCVHPQSVAVTAQLISREAKWSHILSWLKIKKKKGVGAHIKKKYAF